MAFGFETKTNALLNLVYGLTHYECLVAQWSERPTGAREVIYHCPMLVTRRTLHPYYLSQKRISLDKHCQINQIANFFESKRL